MPAGVLPLMSLMLVVAVVTVSPSMTVCSNNLGGFVGQVAQFGHPQG